MKRSIVAALFMAAAVFAAPASYSLDDTHTSIGFRVRHMMVSWVEGKFDKFSGTVVLDDANPANTKLDINIDPASINTNVGKRDEHLRGADFFDVAKYPAMKYVAKKTVKKGDGLVITGDLTMHGVTKEVVLEVTELTAPIKDPYGKVRRGVSVVGKLNRKDFGLAWNAALEAGGVAVGEEIQLRFEVELVQQ